MALTRRSSHANTRSRGFTLVEMLITVAIGTLVVLLAIQAFTKFNVMFGTGTADLALQVDARNFLDHFQHDIVGAYLVSTGKDDIKEFKWDAANPSQTLAVIRIKERQKEDGTAEWTVPAIRTLYSTEPDPKRAGFLRIYRSVEDGDLLEKKDNEQRTPDCNREPFHTYAFTVKSGGGGRRILAQEVKQLTFVPIGVSMRVPSHDEARRLSGTGGSSTPGGPTGLDALDLVIWPPAKCAQIHQIIGLGVHLAMEDVKQGAKGQEGKLEIVCKYWREIGTSAFRNPSSYSVISPANYR